MALIRITSSPLQIRHYILYSRMYEMDGTFDIMLTRAKRINILSTDSLRNNSIPLCPYDKTQPIPLYLFDMKTTPGLQTLNLLLVYAPAVILGYEGNSRRRDSHFLWSLDEPLNIHIFDRTIFHEFICSSCNGRNYSQWFLIFFFLSQGMF